MKGLSEASRGQLEHEMIGHQTDREQCDRMFGFGCGEQVEEGRVVAGLVENRRTPRSPDSAHGRHDPRCTHVESGGIGG